jgi:hypothetical protein
MIDERLAIKGKIAENVSSRWDNYYSLIRRYNQVVTIIKPVAIDIDKHNSIVEINITSAQTKPEDYITFEQVKQDLRYGLFVEFHNSP